MLEGMALADVVVIKGTGELEKVSTVVFASMIGVGGGGSIRKPTFLWRARNASAMEGTSMNL